MSPEHPRYKWAVMAIVMIGTFMSVLDSSIVTVAIPHIMRSLDVGLEESKWIVSGYMLAYAVIIPVAGWASHRFGLTVTLLTALTVFTFASALCGVAWNNESLVIFRVLKALGGGAIIPTSMTMLTNVFGPRERGLAIGIWGVGVVVAPAIGPTLGGLLADTLGWRWIFYINVPVGAVGVYLGLRWLARDRGEPRPFDFAGFSSVSVFLILTLLLMSEAGRLGWQSPTVLAGGAIALAALAVFLFIQKHTAYPIIDLRLFKLRVFTSAAMLGVFRSLVMFGSLFLLPILLQNVMGYSAMQTGLVLAPGAVALGIVMPLGGRLSDRYGARIPALVGVLCTALFLFAIHDLGPGSTTWALVWPQILRGVGIALLLAPVTSAAVNAVPPPQIGMASGIINLFQQVGGAAGIVLLELMLQLRLFARIGPGADSRLLLGSDTAALAFGDVFLMAGGVMLLALIPAWRLGERKTASEHPGVLGPEP